MGSEEPLVIPGYSGTENVPFWLKFDMFFILSISCLLVQVLQSFLVALKKIIIIDWGTQFKDIITMAKRKSSEINSSSTDGYFLFLLLIFFLITTSMDTDRGLDKTFAASTEKDQKLDDAKKKDATYDSLLEHEGPVNVRE